MVSNKSSKCSLTEASTDKKIKKKKKNFKSNRIDLTKNTAKKRRHAAEIPTNKAILSTQPTSQDNQTLNNTINTEQKQQSSSSDNLAVLLTQGLQNNDLNVLDNSYCSYKNSFSYDYIN
ncbi:unnamed protein product [Rotaria socialis]|uniref:Uncharacterized protein n=1 Tax=Rotaria socialis TaxID=392032 RepID=A0A821AG47_9BILA|nr:unnamed protein product [Rotaria socialis]